MRSNFDLWIDHHMNNSMIGIVIIFIGILLSLLGVLIHRRYSGKGYIPFKPFRREGKTLTEDNLFVVLYYRSLGAILIGLLLIFLGILKIFNLI